MHFYTVTILALAALFVMTVSAGSDGCEYKGEVYSVGETFMDECNRCRCIPTGVAACTRKACPVCQVNGAEYKVGESYTAEDGCNTCTCTENGLGACTLMAC